jgi:hypothetical protein
MHKYVISSRILQRQRINYNPFCFCCHQIIHAKRTKKASLLHKYNNSRHRYISKWANTRDGLQLKFGQHCRKYYRNYKDLMTFFRTNFLLSLQNLYLYDCNIYGGSPMPLVAIAAVRTLTIGNQHFLSILNWFFFRKS